MRERNKQPYYQELNKIPPRPNDVGQETGYHRERGEKKKQKRKIKKMLETRRGRAENKTAAAK